MKAWILARIERAAACIALTAGLLTGGIARAVPPTAQQNCDKARATAWAKYQSCVEGAFAKLDGGGHNGFPLYKCRAAHAKKWTQFQSNPGLAMTTCIGTRFTDNGDGTVTDLLSELVWEKKTNLDGTPNLTDPHDADNTYTWSTGAPWKEDGTAFTSFLGTLNSSVFAGASGWRLPTFAELQTIVAAPSCAGSLCACSVDPVRLQMNLDHGRT
jgi:hypothetical protein